MAHVPGQEGDPPAPPPDATPGAGRPAPAALTEGTRLLERFVVNRLLGRGPFGEVYAVVDPTNEADYALKRLPLDLMWGEDAPAIRACFRLVSTLHHPHIATTRFLEIDRLAGELYAISDLAQGVTLPEWQKERSKGARRSDLPHDLVLGLCEQVAEALDYAHSQPVLDGHGAAKATAILHRDLKPGNIMLEPDRLFRPGVPFVKVVDFGLTAEIRAGLKDLAPNDPEADVGATLGYKAPEQWVDGTLTPAVDQWSLAVILYELLAGERPFSASTAQALAEQVREAKPKKPPRISDGQWTVLKRALSPAARDRYDTCMTMIRAFALADTATSEMLRTKPFVRMVSMRQPSGPQTTPVAAETTTGVAAPPPHRPRPLRVLAIVALLGIACGVLIWLLFFRAATSAPNAPPPTPLRE